MSIRTATITIEGVTPYSQSALPRSPKEPKEQPDHYDQRVWREHCHTDGEGYVVVPAMGLKQSISRAARTLGEKILGKGQATWTKHYESGIAVMSEPRLLMEDGPNWVPVRAADLAEPGSTDAARGDRFFVHSDGKRGGGKRVFRVFPMFYPPWRTTFELTLLDAMLELERTETYVREAGRFVGIGRFRPENGGFNGRFDVVEIAWS